MQDFDKWNSLKKKISTNQVTVFPKEREVWFVHLGVNVGYEQNGIGNKFERPVLVIKKWNNCLYLIIPLTSKQKGVDFYYNFIDTSGRKVSAIIAQIRVISRLRFKRKMYQMDLCNYTKITEQIKISV